MASEKLTIELQAKTNQLDAKLKSVDTQLNELGDSADNTDTKFKKMSASAGKFGKALGVATGAAGAALTSIVGLTKVVATYSKEIKIASNISGVATEEFQLMAHATSTVGIGIEKLGGISKDTREKIGDFLNTGGGGFMDFVDAMKLTKEEATKLAKEFSTMAGPDILQEMVNRMEDAGVSAVQMSHALEGMASDTTNLIPLLRNSGEEMQRLSDNMAGVVIPLSDSDIDMFIRMGESADLAGAAIKSLGEQILVDLGDAFIKAAGKAAHFYASLNEGTEAQKTTRLVQINDELKQTRENYEKLDNWANKLFSSEESFNKQQKEGQEKINALLAERLKIQGELAESRFGIGEEVSEVGDQADVGGGTGTITDKKEEKLTEWLTRQEELEKEAAEAQRQRQIEDIENRWLTEEEKLHEKYEKELEIIGEHNENKLALEDEYLQNLIDLDEAREAEKNKTGKDSLKNTEKRLKTEQKLEMQNAKSIMSIMSSLVDSDSAAGKILFLGSQALALAETFVNTKAASIKALTIDPTGILSAKIEVAGALNMAAIAAASIGGVAGGSGGGSTISGGGSIQRPEPIEPDFVQDTDALQLTDSSANSSQVIRIELATDSGDPITVALVEAINKGQREGVF